RRPPPPHFLRLHLLQSWPPGAQNLGGDGQVDARHYHRLALWTPAESGLLERASARQLVRAGSLGHLAAARQWHPLSVWRRQSRRQTRYPESYGAERAYKPASSLVFWPALCVVDGRVGRISYAVFCLKKKSYSSPIYPHLPLC